VTRSPLAYPLNRSADMDAGGAADLQTDIMRFMAILSLCLMAIFALVQSLPLAPLEPVDEAPVDEAPQELPPTLKEPEPLVTRSEAPVVPEPEAPMPSSAEHAVEKTVTLTRPKWVPKHTPKIVPEEPPVASTSVQAAAPAVPDAPPQPTTPAASEEPGFTLRFESDAALARLIAASQVGLYAIESDRAQRMTVSESRISFWDASTPNEFHEMERTTVPGTVIEALARTGANADTVSWGVTLPGSLKTQLDELMREHQGGSLIISASGNIRWEAS